ncbi:MAG: protein translocase subunit SecD [Lachnospiraceae bacterium]|nr:protein translocase subunit SecD [Lachnospiraceae bacterium]
MKKSRAAIGLVAFLAVLIWFSAVAVMYLRDDLTDPDTQHIKLGLDLAGGVSITYQVAGEQEPSEEDMADTREKLQMRAEAFSTEAVVYREGADRITIEIPGETDADYVLQQLGSPGSLYFIRQNDSNGQANYGLTYNSDGSYSYVLNKSIEDLEADGSIIMSGSEVLDAQGVYQTDQLTGASSPVVSMTLSDNGTKLFADATRNALAGGETIAIYYDNRIISAPTVQAVITDGKAIITGSGSIEAANEMAAMIRIGGLKVELNELRSNVVGAQLGQNAVSTSLKAGAIGLVIVIIFMIAVYLLPGVVAALALVLYTAMIFLILAGFDITLTLPGIAGILLSIGMAVDANVIIFARIREELRAGSAVRAAIRAGYGKALSSIIDGNVTTLIAAVVLGILGSGSVRGFAITLAIGIVLSMFTALFVTRFLLNCFHGLGAADEKLYGKGKAAKIYDFVGRKKIWYIISCAAIAIGLITMLIRGAGAGTALNYSLDFVGGSTTNVTFNEVMDLDELTEKVVPVFQNVTGDAQVQVQPVKDSAGGTTSEVIFKTRVLTVDEREQLNSKLVEDFGIDRSLITSETISSTISSEMRRDAVIAVIVALIAMLIYIWFRFKDLRFGASSVIALAHDVLVVLAAYAVTRISVGSTFIACMLTIVGYSINATIVIFDRMRENLSGKKNVDLAELVNRSVSETLSRSIFTSLTTFFMVLSLYIFGVASIREFALPIMVGIISGTYSSVCIAGTLWYILRTKIRSNSGNILGTDKEPVRAEDPDLSEMSAEERKAYRKKQIEQKKKSKITI